MNTQVMFSSATDMWATPQDFFDNLNNEFMFEIDVCATAENAKCKTFYTKEQNGLEMPWNGVYSGYASPGKNRYQMVS